MTAQVRRYRLGRLALLSMEPAELFRVSEPGLRHVVTVNSEILVLAHEEPAYGALLERTWNTIDGRPLQWLAALLNAGPPPRRLSGSDSLEPLAAHCRDTGGRLFLLGGSERANRQACDQLRARYRGLRLEGYAPPVIDSIDDESWNTTIFTRLARFRPDYLVVAFGSPKGEYWIDRARPRLEVMGVRFAAGFGGAINFVAKVVPRAPRWVQVCGLEWLFRLVVERGRFRRTLRMFRMPYHAIRKQRG